MARKKRVIVYGYGNPIFGDDYLGIKAVKELSREPLLSEDIDIAWSSSSPFIVAEQFLDYEKAILIDAYLCEEADEGEIIVTDLDEWSADTVLITPHCANIIDVLMIYRAFYPERFPKIMHIYGVCISRLQLQEGISSTIESKLKSIVKIILNDIGDESK